ncbi:hypothetical protein C8Q75DRAFT_792313 [Abortiporus biennis]|nr:hypothetical protein C8Q75DRAFT_792313 [Abortiporus biennis]
MTTRLKRKLNDLGVDTSSSKANENFCLIGTPLPPLEKTKDSNEFVPLWKQEVRDEKGRRRLHGAFTGGFSAGYFNTVGSKEGWAPSTFVSSRSERAKQKAARPEDFMDEEDLQELRESRNLVDETEEMDFGGTEAELKKRQGLVNEEDDSMASAIASSLAPSPQDSAGARILKKMGWRMGQGVGPRLTYAQRKAQDNASGVSSMIEDDEEAKKHMYPRRDTPVLLAPRKDNFHGLGYSPGMSLMESIESGSSTGGRNERKAGFGLGALNDADEDDLEVYDTAYGAGPSRGTHSRVAYEGREDDDRIAIGSSSKHPFKRPSVQASASSGQALRTFRDGRPAVAGFIVSSEPVVQDLSFPFPEVPKDWRPNPRRVWESDQNKENAGMEKKETHPSSSHQAWKDKFLSAGQRGSILGEAPQPDKTRSVFEYLSQKDRDRLQSIRANVHKPSQPPTAPPSDIPPQAPSAFVRGEIHIPHIHPSVAKAALSGFQPFTTDPVKQSRYTAFLNYASSADSTTLSINPLPHQSNEDFNKELEDYAKSATVFKPLSAAMAGRFRSAVIVETGPNVVEGLHTPTQRPSSPTSEEPSEEKEKEKEDPRMAAVKAGMYGPLTTRETRVWVPVRLLCKRFGVKEPEIKESEETFGEKDQAKVHDHFETSMPGDVESRPAGEPTPKAIEDGSGEGGREWRPRDLANVGLGEDETQGKDILTYSRPSMDVFKAIFASDDEDEGEEAEEEDHHEKRASQGPIFKFEEDTTESELKPLQTVTTASPPPLDEKVDISTFKPTFVPRSDRKSTTTKTEKEKSSKKKKKTALVSFAEDGEDGSGLSLDIGGHRHKKGKDKDGERKKKRRKEKDKEKGVGGGGGEEDDGMWVEAPPPAIVQSLPSTIPLEDVEMDESPVDKAAGPQRGRKRAIDFM